MARNPLFKFLMVRPPARLLTYRETLHFFRFSRDGSDAFSLAAAVAAAVKGSVNPEAAARKVARDFRDSARFIPGFELPAGHPRRAALLALAAIRRLLREAAGWGLDGQLGARIEAALGRPLEPWMKSREFAELKDELWSSLLVAYLLHGSAPMDLGQLADAIRVLHVLERRQAGALEEKGLAALLAATPVLPSQVPGGPEPAPAGEGGPPGSAPGKTPLQQLDEQLGALEAATQELESAHQRQRAKRRAGGITVVPAVADVVRPGAPAGEAASRRLVRDDLEGPNPELLSREAQGGLSAATRQVAAENGVDVALDTWPEAAGKLERAIQTRRAQRRRALGRRRVARLGKRLVPAGQNPIPGADGPGGAGLPPGVPTDPFFHTYRGTVGTVRPVGIGDLEIVTETLQRYEMTEVSHIESVMKGETKSRVYRTLDRTKQVSISSVEQSQKDSTDLQSTDRYELQNEAQSTIANQSSLQLGLAVSAGYGPVQLSTSADYATSNSTSLSTSSSSSYAKEITEETVHTLEQQVKEKQVQVVVNEVEETSTHGFENVLEGASHVNGIYRFLDKVYLAELFNYGKRLMFEFMVPEPAALYIAAKRGGAAASITLLPPAEDILQLTPADIGPGNYLDLVALYGLEGIDPPPDRYRTICKAFEHREPEDPDGLDKNKDFKLFVSSDNTLEIPAGYEALEAWAYASYTAYANLAKTDGMKDAYSLTVWLGRRSFLKNAGAAEVNKPMYAETGMLDVAIRSLNVAAYVVSLEVQCERSARLMDSWRLDTYEKVLSAYRGQKAAYDSQALAASLGGAADVSGKNPDLNAALVKDELERGCLTLLTDQHFSHFDAVKEPTLHFGYPETAVVEAMEEGDYARFFQQAFEWDQMTWLFYPYFWGRKANWLETMLYEDADTDFTHFLKAGMARVVVPCRRHFEEAIWYFLRTGRTWQGGEAPGIDDELYLSIVEELKGQSDVIIEDQEPVDSWELRVPTSLVILQADDALPTSGDAAT
jgi:hypothetical protein